MQGLVTLLYGYIPALFIIGSQVRDCHWSAQGEQHAAGPLLSRCLHVLLRLTLGYEDKVEYVRTIVVARLLWSQWFGHLPGVAHSEEPCEALLSRVVHLMAQHPLGTVRWNRCMTCLYSLPLQTRPQRTCSTLMFPRDCHNSLIVVSPD